MNIDFVVYQLGMHDHPMDSDAVIQVDLVDMGRKGFLRCPVFITLDRSRSAELFAEELREAANDIDRWVKHMSGGKL